GFDPLRAEADGLMLQGKMLAALKRLDQLIDSDEATGRDHLARARVRIELRHADALGDIEAARARGAKKRDLYLARARYHTYVADDPEEASKWLRLAIREAPDGPEPYEMRARYVLGTPGPGRTEQAKRDALQLQRILPQDPVGWSLEGRAAAQASTNASPEERKRLWSRTELVLAEARKRDDDATSCDVPWLEAELGRARESNAWREKDIPAFHKWRNDEVAAYTRALERARRHPRRRRQGLHIFDLLQARGDTYLGPDFWKTGDAVEDFLELERLGPRGTATLYRVGYALMEAGRYEEAIERFRRVLAIDPRHVDSVDFLGFCNLNLGRRALLGGDRDAAVHYWDDAVAAYDARQRLKQDDVDIEYRAETRTLIARYGPPERRQKEIAAAEADFDRRIQQVRAAGGVAVEARYRRSFLLTLQGDEEGAFEDARLGAIYNPSVTPAMLNRYAELALRRAVARGRGELDLVRSALEAADRAVKRSAVFQDRGVRYAYPRRARAYVLLAVYEQKPEARERWLRKAAADATEIERLTTEKEYEFLTVVAAIRARVALARGEATKALAHARRAVELHEQAVKDHLALPQPRPYELLVEALRAAGEKSEADPVARKAARVRRDWPPP
ncbi:MAG: tetratricopeptide repeat protein, partial [Planctomycetota bacterium]|nr:tetratricopeptide repeat protein [Planctomycetota bacterium]